MSKYVALGYWVRGYAEGDYVDAALSADAASSTVTAAGFVASTAAVPAATSATTFSPYRVQQTGIKSDGLSTTDASAGLDRFVGFLSPAESDLMTAAALTINSTGAKTGAVGVMTISGRIKWESEPEPGDTWTSRPEASGIWTDRPEPGDTWSNY
jgi:hypothetical protein